MRKFTILGALVALVVAALALPALAQHQQDGSFRFEDQEEYYEGIWDAWRTSTRTPRAGKSSRTATRTTSRMRASSPSATTVSSARKTSRTRASSSATGASTSTRKTRRRASTVAAPAAGSPRASTRRPRAAT
jgi:Tfp pilus assembly protein PilV